MTFKLPPSGEQAVESVKGYAEAEFRRAFVPTWERVCDGLAEEGELQKASSQALFVYAWTLFDGIAKEWQALRMPHSDFVSVVDFLKIEVERQTRNRIRWLVEKRGLDEEALVFSAVDQIANVAEGYKAESLDWSRLASVDVVHPDLVSGEKELSGDTEPNREHDNGGDCGGSIWQAIEISFTSDGRVQIHRNGINTGSLNYGDLGFADGRTGNPKLAWETLRTMAAGNGIIQNGAKTGAAWSKVEKRIQEIRKAFQKHFGITTDPVPFVPGTGYQALFKIGCSRSYDA